MKRTHEVSQMTNIPRTRLQRYEKKGLINPVRNESDYREYSPSDLQRLFIIEIYRRLGYSLDEIKGMFEDPDFDQIESLNSQRAELCMEIHRISAQIALIDYMKRTARDDYEISTEELIYLFCVYPEYRWVLTTFGDPQLERLLEDMNPYLDFLSNWLKSVRNLSKATAYASAQADGELTEEEQESYFDQVKQLLAPLAKQAGFPESSMFLAADLIIAKSRGLNFDSTEVQQIIEEYSKRVASDTQASIEEVLLKFAERSHSEKQKTLWILFGESPKEQEEFGEYVGKAITHFIKSNESDESK